MQESFNRDAKTHGQGVQDHLQSFGNWTFAHRLDRLSYHDPHDHHQYITMETKIFAIRTTANREDQVFDFISSNITKKNLEVYSLIRPHGLRGYIFAEADSFQSIYEASNGVPYVRGVLPQEVKYSEIEPMIEQAKAQQPNIRKNDIVEIISGPFKREMAKVSRIDLAKEEVVVELLEAAVPIPITVKLDSVKVVRRETEPEAKEEA